MSTFNETDCSVDFCVYTFITMMLVTIPIQPMAGPINRQNRWSTQQEQAARIRSICTSNRCCLKRKTAKKQQHKFVLVFASWKYLFIYLFVYKGESKMAASVSLSIVYICKFTSISSAERWGLSPILQAYAFLIW